MILPVCAGIATADDGPITEPSPTTLPAASTEADPTTADPNKTATDISKTVDETHDKFEQDILDQVIRFDNFFGNVKNESQQKAEYQLRWRNSLRVEQGGQIKPGTALWASFKLSRINERLHLVFFGENEPEPFSSSLPEDPGNPGFDRNSQSMHVVNTELRYSLVQTPTLDIFLGAGVRLIIPPEAFVRGRIQYLYKLSDVSLLRCTETLFVKNFNVFGETAEVDLERTLNPKTLLRWANIGTLSYEIKGMEWGSELSLIRELSPRSGITVTGGVYGNTSINDGVGNYRILARYRRNFLRSWLFYELEPEISWPWRSDGSFPTNLAFTFRLEVLFQGKEK
jgi:hypothetical protein